MMLKSAKIRLSTSVLLNFVTRKKKTRFEFQKAWLRNCTAPFQPEVRPVTELALRLNFYGHLGHNYCVLQ